jgi:hypothetical protein
MSRPHPRCRRKPNAQSRRNAGRPGMSLRDTARELWAIMRKMLLLMLGLAPSAAHAEHLDSLKDFTGIWAPTEGGAAPPSVACKKELFGGDRTPSEARPYELLGICERGIDYLYQPVNCDAANVTPHKTGVEFDERCTTKGSYIDEFHSRITVLGRRAILLTRTPTRSDGGYSPSPKLRYIRCNQTYNCKR